MLNKEFIKNFKLSTFCLIWKLAIFTMTSILNFFKAYIIKHLWKQKQYKSKKQLLLVPIIFLFFKNIWLLELLKNFNMDITVKMARFQIKQSVHTYWEYYSSWRCVFPAPPTMLQLIGVVYVVKYLLKRAISFITVSPLSSHMPIFIISFCWTPIFTIWILSCSTSVI